MKDTSYTQQQAVAYFDAVAMEEKCHTLFLSALAPYASGSALDLGCGDFYLSQRYFDLGFKEVIGLDASQEMLRNAFRRNNRVNLVQSYLPTIPLPDASVDVIISVYALQHLDPKDMGKLYRECYRVLKSSGYLVVVTKAPMEQFLKKIKDKGDHADYFATELVTLSIFNGALEVTEPSHTITDYLSLTQNGFRLLTFSEHSEFPASEKQMGKDHPTFILFTAQKI